MTLNEFNTNTAKALYGYKRHPMQAHAFMITKKDEDSEYQSIGEYLVLDKTEDHGVSERKLINLVSALNGRKELLDIGQETEQRMLFHAVPRTSPKEKSKIIFYSWQEDGGVSKENAVLTIEEDIEDDR